MMVDSSCSVQRISLATRPIHEKEPWVTTTSLARVMTEDNAGLGPLMEAAPALAPATLDIADAAAVVVVVLRDSIFLLDNEAQTGRLGAAHDEGRNADWMALGARDRAPYRLMSGKQKTATVAEAWIVFVRREATSCRLFTRARRVMR